MRPGSGKAFVTKVVSCTWDDTSCWLLTREGSGRCRWQGWRRQLSNTVPDQTMTGTPGMKLCTPVIAGQEATATGVAHAWYDDINWYWWWGVQQHPATWIDCSSWNRPSYGLGVGVQNDDQEFSLSAEWLDWRSAALPSRLVAVLSTQIIAAY